MNNNLFAVTILSLFYCLTSCMPADANNANEEVSKKQKEIDKLTKELNDAKANAKIQADSNTGITKENYDKTLLLVKEKEKALKELQKQINKLPAAAVVVDDAKVIQLQEELKLANNAKNENAIKINELEDKIKQKEKEIEVNAENLNKLNIEKKQFETQNIDLNKKISELQDQIKNQITESQEELEKAKQAMKNTKKELIHILHVPELTPCNPSTLSTNQIPSQMLSIIVELDRH